MTKEQAGKIISSLPKDELEKLLAHLEKVQQADNECAFRELVPNPDPDWTDVYAMAIGETNRLLNDPNTCPDEDIKAYIYEAVMTAIYGEAYFDWYRKRCS